MVIIEFILFILSIIWGIISLISIIIKSPELMIINTIIITFLYFLLAILSRINKIKNWLNKKIF